MLGIAVLVGSVQSAAAARDPLVARHGKRYIVGFEDMGRAAAALERAKGHVAATLPGQKAVAVYLDESAVGALRRDGNVAYVEEDAVRLPLAETIPYGIPMVQAPLLSDAGAGSITVCIIDSGYHLGHEDLPAVNVTGSYDVGSGDPFDDTCGHGTHVAGTVAALANGKGVVGVLPGGNVQLHIVKVFDGADCGWTYSSTLVEALDECRAAGANVVSMSLGGSIKSKTEERAFASAYAAGVLSIAAAGNDGNTRMSYPASYASVISVAAIDANRVVADFSQQNSQVELAAPGVGVLSTVPWLDENRVSASGQSYAAGHIEYSARGSVNGSLADGGLCDSVGAWSGRVVLCQRGVVSFYDKVHNVELGGGVAALIYNNVPGGFLGTLGDGATSAIIGLSLSLEDGQALLGGALGTDAAVVSTFTPGASGYEAWDGTSMATPHVSGVAALVWSQVPAASNQAVRDALAATAVDLGVAGRDVAYGYGLVQAAAAVDYLRGGPACEPTETEERSCSDNLDNDCDGLIDAADPTCGAPVCELGQTGDPCVTNADCCSDSCKGKPGAKTCR
jgi:subtilisin family serine protease